MTHDADRKRLIRARMATTGENYTTARTALLAQTPARTTIANAPERSPDEGDAAYTKHVRSFFDGDRLRAIPARRRPRASVLLHLLCRFEGGRDYAESEVNELLSRAHADYAWLRRELINYRYLIRGRAVPGHGSGADTGRERGSRGAAARGRGHRRTQRSASRTATAHPCSAEEVGRSATSSSVIQVRRRPRSSRSKAKACPWPG